MGLAVVFGLVVSLGTSRAVAQTIGDAGMSKSSFPDEATPPQGPAAPPPPNPPAKAPPVETAAPPPPAEQPAPRGVEPPLSGPRFPVTFSSERASMTIRGPGIEKPLTCSGTCTFSLWEGVYWLDYKIAGRIYTQSVSVTEPERVVIDAPNAGVRGLGIAAILVGGAGLGGAFWYAYGMSVNCTPGGPYEDTAQCRNKDEAVPVLLATAAVGGVVAGIGIIVFINNSKPSVEISPAPGNRARGEPGTFVGLGPVEGSTLPGLSLQAAF